MVNGLMAAMDGQDNSDKQPDSGEQLSGEVGTPEAVHVPEPEAVHVTQPEAAEEPAREMELVEEGASSREVVDVAAADNDDEDEDE